MLPPSSFSTAEAEVGLMWPNLLALGAATGLPKALATPRIAGWALTRTATVGNPLVTMSGIISAFGKTMVKGPGQNLDARVCTSSRSSSGMFVYFSISFP